MKAKVYTLLFSSLLCVSALADNEPWQNPQINEINREPMYAHFIPFTNEANALKQRSLPADVRFDVNPATERRVSLDGTWNFLFAKNNDLCPSSRKLGTARIRCSYLYGYPLPISCQSSVCAHRLQSGRSLHP